MVIPHFRLYCLALFFAVPVWVQADVYKWTEDGQVHYGQQPPADIVSETVAVPPPPAIDPEKAKQDVEALIQSQQAAEREAAEKREARQAEIQRRQMRQENCQLARDNLIQYQNNPGRRIMNANGEVTRPTEQERQQNIDELQQQLNTFCQ